MRIKRKCDPKKELGRTCEKNEEKKKKKRRREEVGKGEMKLGKEKSRINF